MRNARGEVASVCSDTTLSPQEKQQKIRQVNIEAHQQAAGLLSTEQQQAIKACQQQMGGVGKGRSGVSQSDPCAGFGEAGSSSPKP